MRVEVKYEYIKSFSTRKSVRRQLCAKPVSTITKATTAFYFITAEILLDFEQRDGNTLVCFTAFSFGYLLLKLVPYIVSLWYFYL